MEGSSWRVLYTKHLTQKRKTWHDGILRQQGRKYHLYSDANRPLDQLYASSMAVGDEHRTEKHIIQVDAADSPATAPASLPAPPLARAIKKTRQRRTLGLGRPTKRPVPAEAREQPPARVHFSMPESHPAPHQPTSHQRPPSRRPQAARPAGDVASVPRASPVSCIPDFAALGGQPVARLRVPPGGRSDAEILQILASSG